MHNVFTSRWIFCVRLRCGYCQNIDKRKCVYILVWNAWSATQRHQTYQTVIRWHGCVQCAHIDVWRCGENHCDVSDNEQWKLLENETLIYSLNVISIQIFNFVMNFNSNIQPIRREKYMSFHWYQRSTEYLCGEIVSSWRSIPSTHMLNLICYISYACMLSYFAHRNRQLHWYWCTPRVRVWV